MIAKKHNEQDAEGNRIGDRIWFMCPGCKYPHSVRVNAVPPLTGWTWNNDLEKPTFTPSVDSTGTLHCHSFVTDGKIRFLMDCDHDLKGQTVDLPELPAWLAKDKR
jgi:hypothetical protein